MGVIHAAFEFFHQKYRCFYGLVAMDALEDGEVPFPLADKLQSVGERMSAMAAFGATFELSFIIVAVGILAGAKALETAVYKLTFITVGFASEITVPVGGGGEDSDCVHVRLPFHP